MAKTPVKLEVDGYKEREVMMVKYEFINIRVKALNDGTPDLLAWMIERNLPKNGTITFLETKTGKNMKTIKFTNGYCVNFEEKWEDKKGHFEEIEITCQKISSLLFLKTTGLKFGT